VSEREDKLIAKYACGHYASYVHDVAELHGGIVRVENGEFILADGLNMDIMPKPLSMFERWAEEEKCRPADWLQVRD
jgi:hypothetical protein